MFIERRLMNKLGINYQDATSLVYKAHSCLGMLNRGTAEDKMVIYRETKRTYQHLKRHRPVNREVVGSVRLSCRFKDTTATMRCEG